MIQRCTFYAESQPVIVGSVAQCDKLLPRNREIVSSLLLRKALNGNFPCFVVEICFAISIGNFKNDRSDALCITAKVF